MLKRKVILGIWLLFMLSVPLTALNNLSFADDTGSPPSSQPDTNIRVWYDESWEARGFYRLERIAGPTNNFRYEYTTNPTTASNPTFIQGGRSVDATRQTGDPDTSPPPQHRHDYQDRDTTAGASLPQDIVVTEWRTTGHVHFSSEM